MATPPPPKPNLPPGAQLPAKPPAGVQMPQMPKGAGIPRQTINIGAARTAARVTSQAAKSPAPRATQITPLAAPKAPSSVTNPRMKITQGKIKKETMRISLPPKPGAASPGKPVTAFKAPPKAQLPAEDAPTLNVTRPMGLGTQGQIPKPAAPKPPLSPAMMQASEAPTALIDEEPEVNAEKPTERIPGGPPAPTGFSPPPKPPVTTPPKPAMPVGKAPLPSAALQSSGDDIRKTGKLQPSAVAAAQAQVDPEGPTLPIASQKVPKLPPKPGFGAKPPSGPLASPKPASPPEAHGLKPPSGPLGETSPMMRSKPAVPDPPSKPVPIEGAVASAPVPSAPQAPAQAPKAQAPVPPAPKPPAPRPTSQMGIKPTPTLEVSPPDSSPPKKTAQIPVPPKPAMGGAKPGFSPPKPAPPTPGAGPAMPSAKAGGPPAPTGKPLAGKPPVGKPPVGKPPIGKPPVGKPQALGKPAAAKPLGSTATEKPAAPPKPVAAAPMAASAGAPAQKSALDTILAVVAFLAALASAAVVTLGYMDIL